MTPLSAPRVKPRPLRRREPRARPTLWRRLEAGGLLLLGAGVIAASFNVLLRPNGIAAGGVIGLSLVLSRVSGLQPALWQWLLNGALFLVGWLLAGKRFALKSALGAALLPLLVLATSGWPPLTTNPLLAAIYGGMGVGIGVGLLFRGNGSVGGFTLAAQVVDKFSGIGRGRAVLILDGIVIGAAACVFDPEKAMYALIAAFVTGKTIDVVQAGLGFSKVAWVISGQTEAISDAILHDLDRGLTKLPCFGGFSGEARTVLMVVVSQNEVARLKALIREVDPHAFVILSDTTEVLGQGFKSHPRS